MAGDNTAASNNVRDALAGESTARVSRLGKAR